MSNYCFANLFYISTHTDACDYNWEDVIANSILCVARVAYEIPSFND